MLKEPISITALSSISALGKHSNEVWSAYNNNDHFLTQKKIGEQSVWVSALPNLVQQEIENLRNSDARYKHLDDTVLYAIYTGRKAIAAAGWTNESNFGVNIGSSRGATALFEKYHEEFLKNGKSATLSSPTTTLGNISSWVAHDLKSKGPEISHSITCSTALHSLLNGVAWIQSGMTDKFLVGGSEAPLTPFTIAQIQALKIYSRMSPRVESRNHEFPCRAFDLEKTENTMVLGEASASACLEKGQNPDALALIKGIGYATEPLTHNVSISADAQCFQDSMQMALGEMPPEEVDAVVMHSPGTIKGDASEVAAIKKICCNKIPFLTTNKWKVGHTFGASGMLSLEMAILMLTHQRPLPVPFVKYPILPKTIKNVLVNAVGFGGNAVSVLLSK
ncbi:MULTISPECIES: beta-ketoacyl synthase N-terminal-like domain-containing protein [Flavobacteriaceae]|uniref:beta-ketoacyl synthase N-terminal-like domain-containing protein n=1 Tax=Flavobacteriaceae TaxID=49546 RepID=UPI001491F2AA|nr:MULTISPECIES: beta-ketoacyl synthase N-terminal-like domain-containing protein [Allomuricauda]MDC6365385.1 beta-ketoacyl synthase N-terminal-like domain-containing protein [Muricauda sp. AC10]